MRSLRARGEIVDTADDHELRAGQPDRTVKGAASAEHDHFVLHAGGVGQLPHLVRIGAGHAARCRRGHRPGGAGRDHAGFGARQLRQLSSGGLLQFEDVDEMPRRIIHGTAHLGQLQRAAQVGPGTTRVDEGPHAEAAIDVARTLLSGCGGHRTGHPTRCHHRVDRGGRRPFQPGSTLHAARLYRDITAFLCCEFLDLRGGRETASNLRRRTSARQFATREQQSETSSQEQQSSRFRHSRLEFNL